MSARRVVAILLKDLQDAVRDGRVLVLLLLPIAMAIFYNATTDDQDELPTAEVAMVDRADVGVSRELQRAAGRSVELELRNASSREAAERLVRDDDAEFAVVVREGRRPTAQVLVPPDASPTAQSVVALVPDALARATGRPPATDVQVSALRLADRDPIDVVGQRAFTVLIAILLLATFVAMMVVPMQMAEELETGTFGALRLAATGPEVLTAKAVAGVVYTAVGVVLSVVLTSLDVEDPVLFVAANVGLVVSLVGFGLLLGLLVANANAINTYGGFALIPLLGLALAVFFVETGWFATVLDLLPFSQATRLMGDALSAERPFDAGAAAWAVIAVWAVAGYAVLARIATRREL
ncbi:ABC transporter permease [Conexibacter sp. SYSU D00693]|uniref:ABC transporter permease n=1 Tax=Conexibacter sp. SYSU D00693 TaxID=2812560 RepID=UPI00196A826C|nr:ABC transporter permease [Conexibacter sp. SYSU D00693]